MNTGRLTIIYKSLIESSSPQLDAWKIPLPDNSLYSKQQDLFNIALFFLRWQKSPAPPLDALTMYMWMIWISAPQRCLRAVSVLRKTMQWQRSICGRGYYCSEDCRRGHQNAEMTFFFCRPPSSPLISSARHLSALSLKQQQPVKRKLCVASDEW